MLPLAMSFAIRFAPSKSAKSHNGAKFAPAEIPIVDSVMQPIIILKSNFRASVINSNAGVNPPHFTNLMLMLL